MLFKIVAIENR